jgi:lipopolysaccharide/colanic/teichoic acid biosynthesis glycosyltransferase
VKFGSPGPTIYRQSRIGMGGRRFTFYKFRSMRTDSNDRVHREYVEKLIAGQHEEINQGSSDKPVYKMRSDPRITPVGRIIRKTSIDELPQLWNVLKGEMSLVGPRPPVTYEAAKYQSWHMRRLQEMRPGLTGLWQVEGRSRTTFDDMVRLDLRYIRNWSLWLDIRILFKTVFVVLNWNGAD